MPTSGPLEKHLDVYGEVKFAQTYDVFSTASGQIEDLYVTKNAQIHSDERLAKVKLTEDSTMTMELAIQKQKNSIEALQIDRACLERELNDLSIPKENKILPNKSLLLELESIDEAIDTEQQNLENAKILYEAGGISSAEYNKAVQELRNLKNSKQQKLALIEEQNDKNQTGIDEKEKLRLSALNQKKDELAKLLLSIKEAELDLQKSELERSKLNENKVDQYIRTGAQNGIVITLEKEKKSFVSLGEKVATIGILNTNFTTQVICSKSEGNFIDIGDQAKITVGGISEKVTASVTDIKPEGEHLKITLSFQSKTFKGGEYIKITFNKQTTNYDVVVPNEAIVNEGINNYIWVVRNKPGSLGMEYYTVRLKILIADTDETHTAISKGFEFIQPVVTNKSKDLSMNGRVNQMD
jgi:hypothetical protein